MASTILFANNATSVLAGPISPSATLCSLAAGDGAKFPNPGPNQIFKLTFADAPGRTVREIVHVTAVSGDTLTIVRGQENTAALPWNAGDFAENLLTAGTLASMIQTINQTGVLFEGLDTSPSGAPNAVNVASFSPSHLGAFAPGDLLLVQKSPYPNTGPTTISNAGTTAYPVRYKDGSELSGGDWPGNSAALLYFNGTVAQYLANSGPGTAISDSAQIHVGTAVGTGSAITTTLSPAPASGATNFLMAVKITATNPGSATIDWGQGPKPICLNENGAALTGNEMSATGSMWAEFFYDGTYARLLNPKIGVVLQALSKRTVFNNSAGAAIANGGSSTIIFSDASTADFTNNGATGFTCNTPGIYAIVLTSRIQVGVTLAAGSISQISNIIYVYKNGGVLPAAGENNFIAQGTGNFYEGSQTFNIIDLAVGDTVKGTATVVVSAGFGNAYYNGPTMQFFKLFGA